jgi:hypothetical protein
LDLSVGLERLEFSKGSLDWLFFGIAGWGLLQDVGFSYSVLSKIINKKRS